MSIGLPIVNCTESRHHQTAERRAVVRRSVDVAGEQSAPWLSRRSWPRADRPGSRGQVRRCVNASLGKDADHLALFDQPNRRSHGSHVDRSAPNGNHLARLENFAKAGNLAVFLGDHPANDSKRRQCDERRIQGAAVVADNDGPPDRTANEGCLEFSRATRRGQADSSPRKGRIGPGVNGERRKSVTDPSCKQQDHCNCHADCNCVGENWSITWVITPESYL